MSEPIPNTELAELLQTTIETVETHLHDALPPDGVVDNQLWQRAMRESVQSLFALNRNVINQNASSNCPPNLRPLHGLQAMPNLGPVAATNRRRVLNEIREEVQQNQTEPQSQSQEQNQTEEQNQSQEQIQTAEQTENQKKEQKHSSTDEEEQSVLVLLSQRRILDMLRQADLTLHSDSDPSEPQQDPPVDPTISWLNYVASAVILVTAYLNQRT